MPKIVDVKFSELANFTERQSEAWDKSKLHDYLLFGGAGSGGKSYLLRWWCLRQLLVRYSETRIPGLRVGLFSMDYPTLQDRQISKIKREFPEWLGSLKETRSDGYNFALKPEYGGGTIALRNLDDPSKYKSSEFCDIAVEELTENDKETFDDLRFRLRWPGIERPKFIAATNPTGRGHAWVKALWIDKKFPDEMKAIAKQFCYVPALPKDNPHVTDAYEITLRSLPPAKRKALLEGDWSIPEGQYFTNWNRSERAVHPAILSQIIQPWWPKWIGQDWGFGHHSPVLWHTVGNVSPKQSALLGRDWDVPRKCVFTYREHVISLKETGTTEKQLGTEVAEYSQGEKISHWILSRDAFGEKTSQHTPAELLYQGGKPSLPSPTEADMKAGSRVVGWRFMYQLIQDDEWFVSGLCPELLDAIPSLEYDTDKNGEDVRKTNHLYDDVADCFTADTLIKTQHGDVPICDVRVGDKVWTRDGLHKVTNAWMARKDAPIVEAVFSNRATLKCTKDHRIWANGAFMSLDSLRYGDKITAWNPYISTEENTLNSPLDTTEQAADFCTETFGRRITESFHQSTTSTTKTVTERTMQSRILSALRDASTCRIITEAASLVRSTWHAFERWLNHGTPPKRDGHGTAKMPRSTVSSSSKLTKYASAAQPPLAAVCGLSSARINASLSGAAMRDWTTSPSSASDVEVVLQLVDTRRASAAEGNALRFIGASEAGTADVYDLEVEGHPEFFANGILVHNCARYSLADMLNTIRAPLKVRAAEKAEELGITEPQLEDKTPDERREIISIAAVQLKKFYADDKKKKKRRARWSTQ